MNAWTMSAAHHSLRNRLVMDSDGFQASLVAIGNSNEMDSQQPDSVTQWLNCVTSNTNHTDAGFDERINWEDILLTSKSLPCNYSNSARPLLQLFLPSLSITADLDSASYSAGSCSKSSFLADPKQYYCSSSLVDYHNYCNGDVSEFNGAISLRKLSGECLPSSSVAPDIYQIKSLLPALHANANSPSNAGSSGMPSSLRTLPSRQNAMELPHHQVERFTAKHEADNAISRPRIEKLRSNIPSMEAITKGKKRRVRPKNVVEDSQSELVPPRKRQCRTQAARSIYRKTIKADDALLMEPNANPRAANSRGSCLATKSIEKTASAKFKRNGSSCRHRGSVKYSQSVYAKHRRERINARLQILQSLVPNGAKVDLSTMLEEAVTYVKFLQLQVKFLSSDEYWMYTPIAYNGIDIPHNIFESTFKDIKMQF